MEKPFNVSLFGASLDNGNLGVQALAASLVKIIKSQRNNSSITLIYSGISKPHKQEICISGQKVEVNVINYRLSPKSSRNINIFWILLLAILYRLSIYEKWRSKIVEANIVLRTLAESDFIGDIFGGDSFSDIYGRRRIIFGIIPDIIVFLLKKKLVLLPQTYGPYKSIISRSLAKFIVRYSSRALARDKRSLEIIKEMIGAQYEHIADFCPDVAFMLESHQPKNLYIEPKRDQRSELDIVGININGLLYSGGYSLDNMFKLKFEYSSFAKILVLKLLEETNAEILLVPHTIDPGVWNVESDPYAAREVLESIPNEYRSRTHIITEQYDQHEIKGIIRTCNFFVGSRMHACIAALSQGIPTVGVAYSQKFKGVFDSVGLGDMVIDARIEELESTVNKILLHYKNHNKMKADIGIKTEIAKEHIQKTFKEILS